MIFNFIDSPLPQIPPIDFETWLVTIGYFQGIPLGLALIFCIVLRIAYNSIFAKGRGPQPAAFSLRRELRILWLTFLFTLIGLGAGFSALIFLHTRVDPFFLSAAVCFYSTMVFQPLLILINGLRHRARESLVALAPIAIAAFMLFVEPNRVEVLRGELTIPTLPPGCIIKISHFSDIQTVGMGAREAEALQASNEFDPDLVVITGDLTATGGWNSIVQQYKAWLAQCRTRTSVFVVNGDSDGEFDELAGRIGNFTYLKDAGRELQVNGAKLWLAGVDNLRRPPNPVYSLTDAPKGATRILLSHNPDRFFYDGNWFAELGLSGHTHGGQVQIPGYGALVTFTKLGRRYAEGIFDASRLDPEIPFKVGAFTVCAGLGMEGGYAPRVRLFRRPQIILLTLKGPPAH